MSDDHTEDPRTLATDHLEALGLSTYAARTFVALVAIGEATAREVSQVAEVPRPRVYDAVAELEERGLVDVRQSSPRRFWPVSVETAGQVFTMEYSHRVQELRSALDELESRSRTEEQRGVWTVTGRDAVDRRVERFLRDATDEVVLMTVDRLVTDAVLEGLRAATERGVTVRLAHMTDEVETDVHESVPDAEVFETPWRWPDTPAGRVLLVDDSRTLVSVLVPGDDDGDDATRYDETAIWGTGETNSLVTILRAMFTAPPVTDGE